MSYRGTPSFAVGGIEPAFTCICCGAETGSMEPLAVRSLCCKCADDHPEYEDGHCVSCGEERDYAPSEDDVGFGSYPLLPGEPLGVPASSMNGNAAVSNASPENRQAWDNWVAFCERNGHP